MTLNNSTQCKINISCVHSSPFSILQHSAHILGKDNLIKWKVEAYTYQYVYYWKWIADVGKPSAAMQRNT